MSSLSTWSTKDFYAFVISPEIKKPCIKTNLHKIKNDNDPKISNQIEHEPRDREKRPRGK